MKALAVLTLLFLITNTACKKKSNSCEQKPVTASMLSGKYIQDTKYPGNIQYFARTTYEIEFGEGSFKMKTHNFTDMVDSFGSNYDEYMKGIWQLAGDNISFSGQYYTDDSYTIVKTSRCHHSGNYTLQCNAFSKCDVMYFKPVVNGVITDDIIKLNK